MVRIPRRIQLVLRRARWIPIVVLLGACVEARQAPPDDAALRAWVRQLGAADAAARDRAEEELGRAGGRAEALLTEATSSSDTETRLRANRLLQSLERTRKRDRLSRIPDPPILFLSPAAPSHAIHRYDPETRQTSILHSVVGVIWELQWCGLTGRLSFYDQQAGLRIRRLGDPELRTVPTPPVRGPRGLAWSPSGNAAVLVCEVDDRPRLFYWSDALREAVGITPETQAHYDPTWSPDGRQVAFVRNDAMSGKDVDLYRMTVSPAGTPVRLTSDGEPKAEPAWSPDGRWIAFAWVKDAGGLGLLSTEDPKVPPRRLAPGASSPAWSPDSTRIAYVRAATGDSDCELRIIDREGKKDRVLVGGPGLKETPSWSPDGKKLLFLRTDGNASQVYVVNADGEALTRITLLPDGATSPVWAPQE